MSSPFSECTCGSPPYGLLAGIHFNDSERVHCSQRTQNLARPDVACSRTYKFSRGDWVSCQFQPGRLRFALAFPPTVCDTRAISVVAQPTPLQHFGVYIGISTILRGSPCRIGHQTVGEGAPCEVEGGGREPTFWVGVAQAAHRHHIRHPYEIRDRAAPGKENGHAQLGLWRGRVIGDAGSFV